MKLTLLYLIFVLVVYIECKYVEKKGFGLSKKNVVTEQPAEEADECLLLLDEIDVECDPKYEALDAECNTKYVKIHENFVKLLENMKFSCETEMTEARYKEIRNLETAVFGEYDKVDKDCDGKYAVLDKRCEALYAEQKECEAAPQK